MREFVGTGDFEYYSHGRIIIDYAAATVQRTGSYGEVVVESYLKEAGRLKPSETIASDSISYFFMPVSFFLPNEVKMFTKIGRGEWHRDRLTMQNRISHKRVGGSRIVAEIAGEKRVITQNPRIIEGFTEGISPLTEGEMDAADDFNDIFNNLKPEPYLEAAEKTIAQALEEFADVLPGWNFFLEDYARHLIEQDFLNDFYARVASSLGVQRAAAAKLEHAKAMQRAAAFKLELLKALESQSRIARAGRALRQFFEGPSSTSQPAERAQLETRH